MFGKGFRLCSKTFWYNASMACFSWIIYYHWNYTVICIKIIRVLSNEVFSYLGYLDFMDAVLELMNDDDIDYLSFLDILKKVWVCKLYYPLCPEYSAPANSSSAENHDDVVALELRVTTKEEPDPICLKRNSKLHLDTILLLVSPTFSVFLFHLSTKNFLCISQIPFYEI